MDETVIVVTGPAPLDADAVAHLPSGAIVIAADGGLDHALAAGLTPAALVGDLDSISADGLRWAEAHATVQRHDPAKDRTDTELALATAAGLQPGRLVLVAGGGDRFDHTVTALGALGHPDLTSIPLIEAWWGDEHAFVVHGPGALRLVAGVGTRISLVSMHGRCTGVSIDHAEWPLDDAELAPLSGLGVSNVATADEVTITVSTGVLTVFTHPPATAKEST